MPWSGGVFNRLNGATGWVDDANAFIGIEATRHDTQDNDFRDGINNTLAKDGSNVPTANLNLGSLRFTNAGASTARTDLAQVAQVQDGDYIWLGTTAGTATAQTASATPAITAYKAGQKFRAIIGTGLSSTGQTPTAHTININGLGAKNMENGDGPSASSPTIGTFVAGNIIELVYNGTAFKITNEPGSWLNWTPTLTAPTGSLSSVSTSYAYYRKIGHVVVVSGFINFTTTSVGPSIEITNLPIAFTTTTGAWVIQPCFIVHSGANSFGYVFNGSVATTLAFTKDVAGNSFGSGSGNIRFTMTYNGQ